LIYEYKFVAVLPLTEHHAMKAHCVSGGTALLHWLFETKSKGKIVPVLQLSTTP